MAEQMADSTAADIEFSAHLSNGKATAEISLNICGDPVQKLRLLCRHGRGARVRSPLDLGQQLHRVADHRCLPAVRTLLRLPDPNQEQLPEPGPGGPVRPEHAGLGLLFRKGVGKKIGISVHKLLAQPQNIAFIGLFQPLRQQRPMADPRRHEDHIPLLQPVALGSHQIFRAAAVAAKQKLIESMAVQLQLRIGVADVPVRIHIPGGHLQLLINGAGIHAHAAQLLLQPLLQRRSLEIRNILGQLPQIT